MIDEQQLDAAADRDARQTFRAVLRVYQQQGWRVAEVWPNGLAAQLAKENRRAMLLSVDERGAVRIELERE